MKKNSKRIILYTTTIIMLTAGATFKINKDKSDELVKEINEYTDNFTNDDFLIAAHRGFSSLEIENTTDAFSLANSKDYIDFIEMDVRLTKDNKLVLSHDDYLLAEGEYSVDISSSDYDNIMDTSLIYQNSYFFSHKINFAERSLINSRINNLIGKKYKLNNLLEGINSSNNKKIILDLKFQNNEDEFIEELIKELKGINTDNIIFQSTDIGGLLELKEKTNFRCQLLVDSKYDLMFLDDFDYYGIKKNLATYDLVKNLLDTDNKVAVWTINNSNDLDNIIDELGDSYKDVLYITDYPDLIATKLYYKQKEE